MAISVATAPASDRSGSGTVAEAVIEGAQSALGDALARVAELEAELTQQARLRTELIHLVSHELRTPITIISGFNRLVRSEAVIPLSEEQDRFIGESLKACRRLDRFVDDLLAARPDGATPMAVVQRRVSTTDLEGVIQAQLESMAPLLADRRLNLECVFEAPRLALSLDLERIEQVVTNLLSNAIRYGRPGGSVRVSVRRSQSEDGRQNRFPIEVAVEDDGPGIPVPDRERLFEPYVRGRAKQDRSQLNGDGLGIGLSICRRIIAAHGGSISVDASSLGGARFEFRLPSAPHSDLEG